MSLSKWILIAALFAISAHSYAEPCLSGLPDSARTAGLAKPMGSADCVTQP